MVKHVVEEHFFSKSYHSYQMKQVLINVIIGANDTLYWIESTEDEYKNQQNLTKPVRLSEFFTDLIGLNKFFRIYDYC